MCLAFQNLQKFIGSGCDQDQESGLWSKKVFFYIIFPLCCNYSQYWWKLGK